MVIQNSFSQTSIPPHRSAGNSEAALRFGTITRVLGHHSLVRDWYNGAAGHYFTPGLTQFFVLPDPGQALNRMDIPLPTPLTFTVSRNPINAQVDRIAAQQTADALSDSSQTVRFVPDEGDTLIVSGRHTKIKVSDIPGVYHALTKNGSQKNIPDPGTVFVWEDAATREKSVFQLASPKSV